MRTLKRNKVKFYYALFVSREELIDEHDNVTGYKPVYGDPIEAWVNKSASQGEVSARLFGETIQYDKVLIFGKIRPPIDENSILWVDQLDITKSHDYIVKKVAESLNGVVIAIKKVNVNA